MTSSSSSTTTTPADSDTFPGISVEIKVVVKDYTDIAAALAVDPKAIREKLLETEDAEVLATIAEHIVTVGPRPDKTLAKLARRSNIAPATVTKIREKVGAISAFIARVGIRATQFQAAFPDLILRVRESIMKGGGVLQRFVPETTLPILFQFPGSGPVLPDDYRDEEHYGAFNIALTKALSQGQNEVNWTIVHKSLEWKIDVKVSSTKPKGGKSKKEQKDRT